MPRKVPSIAKRLPAINWVRGFFCGATAAILLVGFIDTFFVLGVTPFSMEVFLGTLATHDPFNDHSWTIGFIMNLIVGGLFGILYGYFFEYAYRRATPRVGIWLGFLHTFAAAAFVFPFFRMADQQMGIDLYPSIGSFGILGSGLGAATPILLLFGHLLFGATMGLFYGPVRAERARAMDWEPADATPPEEWEKAHATVMREKLGV